MSPKLSFYPLSNRKWIPFCKLKWVEGSFSTRSSQIGLAAVESWSWCFACFARLQNAFLAALKGSRSLEKNGRTGRQVFGLGIRRFAVYIPEWLCHFVNASACQSSCPRIVAAPPVAIRKWEFILLKIYVAKLSVPIIILWAMPFRNEPFGLVRRDTEFLADNGHVFVIQYRELESRKRRTKEEELSEELGLLPLHNFEMGFMSRYEIHVAFISNNEQGRRTEWKEASVPRCTKDSRDITIFFPLFLLLQLFRSQVLYFFLPWYACP